MIELQHRSPAPQVLLDYLARNPAAQPSDFDNRDFQPVKRDLKSTLNEDQAGLCVYCEQQLAGTEGQIDHIKPKGGPNAHPHLAFDYFNYAHSCVNEKTCGQKKKAGLLPIEPGPGCNDEFSLSVSDGRLEPLTGVSRQRKHAVRQTRDMLGLQSPMLVRKRKQWLEAALEVAKLNPALLHGFLADKPFRHILATVFKARM